MSKYKSEIYERRDVVRDYAELGVFFTQINTIVDWRMISNIINKHYKSTGYKHKTAKGDSFCRKIIYKIYQKNLQGNR